jgi:hypothetical protein
LGQEAITLFFASIILVIMLLGGLLWLGWWVTRTRGSLSPYTKQPMMLGVDMPHSMGRQVEEFMKSLAQPENEPFDYTKAAVCRQTGRIFPNAVKRGELIHLKWNFLDQRCKGSWVSWGSLTESQQGIIRLHHGPLDRYQTEKSCSRAAPQDIEPLYVMLRPGPLYVDVAKKILLGWQNVPGTNFEVLVVQKPIYESIDEML